MTYEEIVAEFIRDRRDLARAEMQEFRKLPSLATAIRSAALAHWLPSHTRHPHQRQSHEVLQVVEGRLQKASDAIGAAADFDALHGVVKREIGRMPKIGDLAVYDIAYRIGAFLGKAPTLVYLHAGTVEGARALGFTGKTLDPAQLPSAFSRLTPAELEDCLCIYKVALRAG
jgi:hypothetical protein